jgi:hypothetical protein
MLFLHTTFFTIVVVFLSERVRAAPARPAAATTAAATATASAAAGPPAHRQAQVQEQGEEGATRQDG